MKAFVFVVLSLLSGIAMANGYCDSRPGAVAVMQCYDTLSQNELHKLKRLYGELRNHPGMEPQAFEQLQNDHLNWAGMMEASCRDSRCTYVALVNRNNLLTTRLNSLGGSVPQQCGRGASAAMVRVCQSPDLWDLEKDLVSSYNQAVNEISDNDWLKKDQVEWASTVRDRCRDDACLQKVYEERIDELFWIKKHASSQ